MTDPAKTLVTRPAAPRKRPRWLPAEAAASDPAARPLGPRAALGVSVWFGLAVGLLELGLTFAVKPVFDASPGLFRMNRHILWTVPLVNLLLFAGCGLASAWVMRLRPRSGARAALVPLCALAVLTFLLALRRLHTGACLPLALGLGYRLARRVERHLPGFLVLARRSGPVLALAAAGVAGVSLGSHLLREPWAIALVPPIASAGPDAPNVLLVVLDTVRADRLSLYGYPRPTTPNLERLARRGVTFTQARSTAPWTLPSHSSLMTGRWHHELSVGIDRPLDAEPQTLAEFLSANGYATAGFVANTMYCGAEAGLDRGFARYDDHDLSPAGVLWTTAVGRRVLCRFFWPQDDRAGEHPWDFYRKTASDIRTDLLSWLDGQQDSDRPFFAFLNIFDAHNPYIPPAGFPRPFGTEPKTPADRNVLNRWFIMDKSTLTQPQRQAVSDAYDDCLAYIDGQIAGLLDDLDQRGKLANTLVVITSDHGEHFGEHGLYGHASSLYDQEVRVPLLVLLPGGRHPGRSVSTPVSLRDVPATIADLLGLDSGPAFPGRSLTRFWPHPGQPESSPEPVLVEVEAPVHSAPNQGRSPVFRGPMKAVVSETHVFIRNGDGREELYNASADPEEQQDLSTRPESADLVTRLRAELDRLLR
ncbi:MAG: sulfatase-like hydrolase/transferase [Isosphaeraceae bacterium]